MSVAGQVVSEQKKESTPQIKGTGKTTSQGSSPSTSVRGLSFEEGSRTLAPSEQGGYDTQSVQLKPAGGDKPKPITGDNRYEISGEEGSQTRAWGVGRGTGADDNAQVVKKDGEPVLDENGNPTMGPAKNSRAEISNDVKTFDDRSIEKRNSLGEGETGAYTETFAGTGTKTSGPGKPTVEVDDEGKVKPGMTFAEGEAAVGAGAKIGYRNHVGDKDGSHAAFDIHAGAKAGASAKGEVGITGVKGEAAASASADLVNVSGNADLTKKWKVDGVTDDVVANVGVSGKVRIGADAGVGIKGGISTDMVGVEAHAGAFIGAEAEVDLHASLGPISVKLKAAGLAGAGAEAKGALMYKDGKIVISGQALAAIGYGGKLGGELVIDVRQAVELGLVGAKQLHKWADADGDGKLSLNDAATHLSQGANAGADKLDSAADRFIAFTDRDGDGKFTMSDMGAMANDAAEYGSQKVSDAADYGAEKLGQAKNAVVTKAGEAWDAAGEALDATKQAGQDLYDAVDTPEKRAALLAQGKQQLAEGFEQTKNAAIQKGKDAYAWSESAVNTASQKLDELKSAAKDGAVGAYETVRDYDYAGAANAAKDKAVDTGKAAIEQAGQAIDAGVAKVKQAQQAVVETADKAKQTVVETYRALETPEGRAQATEQAKRWAAQKKQQAEQAIADAKAAAEKKINETAAAAKVKAAEGYARAEELAKQTKEAIKNAPAAVANKAVETYDSAVAGVTKAYGTASDGLSTAGAKVSGTASKVWNYVKPW